MVPSVGAGAGAACPAFPRLKRQGEMDGAGGGSRTPKWLPTVDFLTSAAFAVLAGSAKGAAVEVWGLDYPFTVPRTWFAG